VKTATLTAPVPKYLSQWEQYRQSTLRPLAVGLTGGAGLAIMSNPKKMPLSERVFKCPCCGLELDRDHNAAVNILGLGLQSLGINP